MRKIKVTEGLNLNINHAGFNSEALTNCTISIPLDAVKYLSGVNLIDCIKANLLPDITTKIDAISQELTTTEISQIRGWLTTGIIHQNTDPMIDLIRPEVYYLIEQDDAIKGIVNFTDGETRPTYT